MSKHKDTVRALEEVFAPIGAGPNGTATVSTTASSLDADLVTMVAEEMDLTDILRDVGIVTARKLADELERRALKPSDFADMPELVQLLAKRLKKALADSEEFSQALYKQLKMRG